MAPAITYSADQPKNPILVNINYSRLRAQGETFSEWVPNEIQKFEIFRSFKIERLVKIWKKTGIFVLNLSEQIGICLDLIEKYTSPYP